MLMHLGIMRIDVHKEVRVLVWHHQVSVLYKKKFRSFLISQVSSIGSYQLIHLNSQVLSTGTFHLPATSTPATSTPAASTSTCNCCPRITIYEQKSENWYTYSSFSTLHLSPSQLFEITIFASKKKKSAKMPAAGKPAAGTPAAASPTLGFLRAEKQKAGRRVSICW